MDKIGSSKRIKKKRPQKFVNIEEFSDIIGGHGRWQMLIFAFFFVCCIPHCMHILVMTFFAPKIDHWCSRPPEWKERGISVEEWKKLYIPKSTLGISGLNTIEMCTKFGVPGGNYTYPIPNTYNVGRSKCGNDYEYDEFYNESLTAEFNLVCDQKKFVPLAKSIYMAGFLVSVSLSGQASDRFGRKLVVITCLVVFLLAAFLTLLATSMITFLILRFFIAVGITSVFTMAYVILSEVVSTNYRSAYCFTFKLGWVFGYMCLPGIAYLLPNWRHLQWAITAPFLILMCVFWIVPETPRWLIITGNYKEAQEVMMRAAKINGKDLSRTKDVINAYLQQLSKADQGLLHKGTFFDLLRTPNLRKITLFMYFCWFIISYIYYALSFNTNDLGGNPYWTFFISGAVELPSIFVFLIVSKYIGHRNSLLLCNIISGICLLVMMVIPKSISWLVITAAMAGKFFCSASFDIVYIYSAEVFPTVVRNVGVGTCSTWARIGALIAPFLKEMGVRSHEYIPYAIPGVLSIISGIMLLWLPETKDKKLPDTLEEGERFGSSKQKENDHVKSVNEIL